MERSFPEDVSSDGIHFDRPRGVEWLNNVFQRHISTLEEDLLETAHFTFGPPQHPLSLPQDPFPVAWERESTQETARETAGPDYVSQVVLAGNSGILAAWCGVEPDADSGSSDETRDAL